MSFPGSRATLALALALGACGPHETQVAGTPDAAPAVDAGPASTDGADGPEGFPPCLLGGTTALQPTIIACGPAQPTRLAIDGVNLYWTDQRRGAVVFKVPLAGGTPTVLVYDDEAAAGLAVDAKFVYYTQPARGTVMRVPIEGGAARAVAAGLDTPTFLALGDAPDGPSLYWSGGGTLGTGTITRIALTAGATPETLIDGQQQPRALTVADGFVYWTDLADGTILRAPNHLAVSVGTSIRVATRLAAKLELPTDIVVVGGYAYVPDEAGRIARVPIAGGAVETVTAVSGFPFGVATDGISIYWTTLGKGGVFKAPLGANVSPTVIADGQHEARFLVASPNNVYWGVWGDGGAVRRMATLGRAPGVDQGQPLAH
jgi:hypothetical protein